MGCRIEQPDLGKSVGSGILIVSHPREAAPPSAGTTPGAFVKGVNIMIKPVLASLCVFGLFLGGAGREVLAASLADCGNINIEANAKCKVMAEGGCTVADCTPVACSGALYAQCKGSCEVPDVACEGSCQADCQGQCSASGGSIDCDASCSARCGVDCKGDCSAQCQSDANKTECEAKCKGTCEAACTGECEAKCSVVPPEATCEAKCKGSCEGSCTVTGNLGCHMQCRTRNELSCTGGCEVACTKPDAAIFCNGQYVDHGGHAESCLSALEATVTAAIDYDAHASGSASCEDGTCKAQGEAEAKASCAMARASLSGGSWLSFGLFGVAMTGLVLRRRQHRRA